jgi:hypothetical protein
MTLLRFFFLLAMIAAYSALRGQETHPFGASQALSWYPNPVRSGEQIYLSLHLDQARPVGIEVLDPAGRTIMAFKETYRSGDHNISLYTHEFEPGLYVIRIRLQGKVWTETIAVE